MAPAAAGRRWRVVFWMAVFAAAIILRFWQLPAQLLIDDEWHALHRLMQAGYRDIFLSFGHADYSIPLTLLFRALADTGGLHEWQMRALPLVAGVLAVGVVPWLLGAWLDWRERLLLGALMAISPLLIHFSRYVRPYAMVALLGFVAVIMLWQWWHHGGRGRALLFAAATVLAAWLHPLSALFAGAALSWFGAAGAGRWWRDGQATDLVRVLILGTVTVAICAALLLPPIISDPWSIAAKSGLGRITATTLLRSWELIAGTAGNAMGVVMLLLALVGAAELWRRDRGFLLYWVWIVIFATTGIALFEPEWIQNALVFVRYSAIAVPLYLALAAVGALRLAARWPGSQRAGRRARAAAGFLLVIALFAAGPLPTIYRGTNQFTNAVRYQLDYDFERSVFHALMAPLPIPAVYRQMAAEPGDWEIIEAGWYFESNQTAISQYQRVHQLPIRIGMISGLCTDWTWGELEPDGDQRIELNRFVFLKDLLDQPPDRNRFVVFHRQPHFAHSRELPDIEPCIAAFSDRFGPPWYESEALAVFRLPAPDPADDA